MIVTRRGFFGVVVGMLVGGKLAAERPKWVARKVISVTPKFAKDRIRAELIELYMNYAREAETAMTREFGGAFYTLKWDGGPGNRLAGIESFFEKKIGLVEPPLYGRNA